MWEERQIHLLSQHSGDTVMFKRTQMPTHDRSKSKIKRMCEYTSKMPCWYKNSRKDHICSWYPTLQCCHVTLPEGKSGLCGKGPNDGEAPSQPGKITALAKLSPQKISEKEGTNPSAEMVLTYKLQNSTNTTTITPKGWATQEKPARRNPYIL